MKKPASVVVTVIGILLTGAVVLTLGWLLGATIFGNYFENFTFAGLRGYEAGGQLVSVIFGVLYFIIILSRIEKKELWKRVLEAEK